MKQSLLFLTLFVAPVALGETWASKYQQCYSYLASVTKPRFSVVGGKRPTDLAVFDGYYESRKGVWFVQRGFGTFVEVKEYKAGDVFKVILGRGDQIFFKPEDLTRIHVRKPLNSDRAPVTAGGEKLEATHVGMDTDMQRGFEEELVKMVSGIRRVVTPRGADPDRFWEAHAEKTAASDGSFQLPADRSAPDFLNGLILDALEKCENSLNSVRTKSPELQRLINELKLKSKSLKFEQPPVDNRGFSTGDEMA